MKVQVQHSCAFLLKMPRWLLDRQQQKTHSNRFIELWSFCGNFTNELMCEQSNEKGKCEEHNNRKGLNFCFHLKFSYRLVDFADNTKVLGNLLLRVSLTIKKVLWGLNIATFSWNPSDFQGHILRYLFKEKSEPLKQIFTIFHFCVINCPLQIQSGKLEVINWKLCPKCSEEGKKLLSFVDHWFATDLNPGLLQGDLNFFKISISSCRNEIYLLVAPLGYSIANYTIKS